MQATTFFLALALLAAAACNHKTGSTSQQVQPGTEPSGTEKPAPADPPRQEAYQVAGFEKGACFGRCPVYEVKFYSDGKVTWNGRMNVERMGWHEARVEPAVLKSIRDKAHEVGFFDFYNEYPVGKKVADLPATVTFIRIGDMEKQVTDLHEAPAKLKEFEKFLEDLISGLDWK